MVDLESMTTLHDGVTLAALKHRISTLRADARPRWGRMSVDQMLRHVNEAMRMATGELPTARKKFPIPTAVVRLVMLNLPFPRGAATAPELVARERYDFEVERARCLSLLDAVTARPLGGPWPVHPLGGQMNGKQWSRLGVKHLDHHLRQFGV